MKFTRFFIAVCIVTVMFTSAAGADGYAVTLEECVAMALRNNPDIQKQQLSLDLAEQDISEMKSANFGSLAFVASYNHYNLPRTLAPLTPATIADDPANVSTTRDLFLTGIVYDLPLFTGFAQTSSVAISGLQKKMAASQLKLSREQLIYNVKSIFLNILSLQAQEKAQGSYVEALQRLNSDINSEYRLGKKALLDQLKAGADLKNAEAVQEGIVASGAILRATLTSLTGVEHSGEFEEISLYPESMTRVASTSEEELSGLERLRAGRLEVEKNEQLIRKAESSLYPQLVFNSSYGQNFGPNDDTNKYEGDWKNQEVWQAGLNLEWKIFDFGGSKAGVQKAKIRERQSRYELTKTELELKRQLQEAVTKTNTAVTDYESAREEQAMTVEAEAIEQVRYDQGVSDINDLLSTKARNQLAVSRVIAAGYRYRTARYYLDYLLEKGESLQEQARVASAIRY